MNIQKRLYTCACSPQVSPTVLTTSCSPTISAIFERVYLCVCARAHSLSLKLQYIHIWYRFWHIRVNSPADTYAPIVLLFHTDYYRIGSVKEDLRTRPLIDARPLSTFTALPLRNSQCVAPDIDNGTVACFEAKKYFRYRRWRERGV